MSIRIGTNVITRGSGSGSDPNFLPNDTIIMVETNGSGQFTKLSEVTNSYIPKNGGMFLGGLY